MNDPNGMFVDSDGVWHLYYQCEFHRLSSPRFPPGKDDKTKRDREPSTESGTDNPTALVAGNQHWGHATSRDLYHWTNQPIALYPPNATTGMFSGCVVVDKDNTSGMFNGTSNGVVAI